MCNFCESETSMTSRFADLKIDSDIPFTDKVCLTIYNIKKHCPPFSRCCDRSMNVELHFEIEYCPLCGNKLTHKKSRTEE